jgi:sterol desaturase/sphingolipid hydroxylase (fatty acid hydroxylase superfamily)
LFDAKLANRCERITVFYGVHHMAQKLFLIVALLAIVIEAWVLHRKHRNYNWRGSAASMVNAVIRAGVRVILPVSLAMPIFALASEYRIATIAINGWLAFAILFFAHEFFHYWAHRASHRIRWFWANHAVHHSSNQMSFAAAVRLGSFGRLMGIAAFHAPLVWLGFPKEAVLGVLSVTLMYEFWIHAALVPKLGWFEYVFNSPSSHRVHHAANLEYLDKNYGGMLIIFDRLFGTYAPERDDIQIRYGLVEPELSNNPLKIEFVEWRKLFKDLLAARSLRAVVGHVVMPPGWRPDGQHQTTEALRQLAQTPSPDPASTQRGSTASALIS